MRSPRLTFLGTGTSGGIPLIACDCAVCTSSDPRDTRTRTGACVRWVDGSGAERVVLLDTTPDLRVQAVRENLWRCDAILYTHNHVDHIFGLDEVRRFNAVMKAPIDVYGEGYVLDSLRRVYKHIFDAHANVNDSFVATLIPHEVPDPSSPASRPIEIHGVRFTPIRLLHGRLPILGWRIESEGSEGDGASPFPLAYCTDVSAVPPESWGLLTGLRTLVLDALRVRHHPTHLTLDQAVNMAERIGAEKTWFVHMAHELGHGATEAGLPENIRLAYDGLTLGRTPEGVPRRSASPENHRRGRFDEG